jgi:hypothetical protein
VSKLSSPFAIGQIPEGAPGISCHNGLLPAKEDVRLDIRKRNLRRQAVSRKPPDFTDLLLWLHGGGIRDALTVIIEAQ